MTGPKEMSGPALVRQLGVVADKLDDPALRSLLREAARRLAAQTEQGYRVASVRQLSIQSPTLYDGTLEDGDEFMVRYKNHRLTVYIDDQLVEYDELPETLPPNRITLEEIEKWLNGLLVFPSERIACD